MPAADGAHSSHIAPSAPAAYQDLIVGIDHVAVAVEDLEAAITWYSSTLGFSLLERRRTVGANTSMTSAVMRAGGAIVVLVQGEGEASQVTRFIDKFGAGVQHLAFLVSDLDEAVNRVNTHGGEAETGILADEGIRQTFLRRDPGSGVRIELIERNGGEFSDSSVERLFRAMETRDIY